MKKGRQAEYCIPVIELHPGAEQRRIEDNISMSIHSSLGWPGRSGCVRQECDIIRGQIWVGYGTSATFIDEGKKVRASIALYSLRIVQQLRQFGGFQKFQLRCGEYVLQFRPGARRKYDRIERLQADDYTRTRISKVITKLILLQHGIEWHDYRAGFPGSQHRDEKLRNVLEEQCHAIPSSQPAAGQGCGESRRE